MLSPAVVEYFFITVETVWDRLLPFKQPHAC